MITGIRDIYEKVAKQNNLDPELVKSIGTVVFQNLRECLNKPDEVAYELPKVGVFNVRFQKFENYYLAFVRCLERGDEKAKKQLEDNPELFEINTKLYNRILEYREKKKEKRNARYEAIKSSEDKSEEH